MPIGLLVEYWWVLLIGIAVVVGGFVLVAGRLAEGGFGQRVKFGWHRWRGVSRRAADVQARVILTVFFFTVAAPFGLVRTHLADPLRLKPARGKRTWLAREVGGTDLDDARRQY